MPTLALVMIVKNEADNLVGCLRSCEGVADEIIVVDGGSTDNTVDIARELGAKVIAKPNWEGFGLQRRFAQSHVTSDWVFWIDADERLTPELKSSIKAAVSQNDPNSIYSVARLSWVFGKFIRHSGWYPDRVLRLHPTALTQYTNAPVHERLDTPQNARVQPLAGDLLHYTYRDLQHYLVKSAQYADLWAQQRSARGKRGSLLQGFMHGIGCFLRMYILRAGFLDGRQGLLLALLSAHSTFAKYADLWVRQQPKP
ncbi:MAG: glycosyltransferase family 2 protein [Burkholderiaceae bacterium]|nr:glycosyltransferase family 2 protein [Burkholderiaceae bacterium]MCD8515896.1 glycosyltransferase family 2 protein [Burkholderiaceae bacterium]MCD8538084.1 glycosyltransferase family 2 protein [Burkholderiaceae bacterium]MCD8565689.1 glycosyltransferase family 2 protein [Burkholderiaceae bacterium]